MIKYIGSKRVLVPSILAAIDDHPDVCTVLDLFSGTARVGHALKRAGYRVVANDQLAYAHRLARCYVEADAESVGDAVAALVTELNALPPAPGWFTETYCRRSRYFHPDNGGRIEAIRRSIDERGLPEPLESVLLVALMEAADRVDSTVGVQMAYLKAWAPRALKPLELRVPELLPKAAHGPGAALCLDAVDAAGRVDADLAYLDPPYNQHAYLGNYHVWETLVRWDEPEVYGVACKRVDCRDRKSAFNRRTTFRTALGELLERIQAPILVVSFSDEGFIDRAGMESILAGHGSVEVREHDHPRYVGARIGIHNQRGERVGRVGRLRNREFLFVVRR